MPLSDPKRDLKRKTLKEEVESIRSRQAARRKQLAKELEQWAVAMARLIRDAPQTDVLEVIKFESTDMTDSYEVLDDGSVFLTGSDHPERDQYTVTIRTKLSNIRATRLDSLTHESLPGEGPGRGDEQRTNFVLHEFSISVNGSFRPGAFKPARTDFSQKNWPVSGAIDGETRTGWAIAPQFGKPHWAIFELVTPLNAEKELVFRLVQNYGGARTIGRLKISAITGDPNVKSVPAEIALVLKKPLVNWTNKKRKRLWR